MKNFTTLMLALFFGTLFSVQAQTVLHSESFETDGEGTRYTSNTFLDCVNSDFFLRTNTNPVTPPSCGTTFFGSTLGQLQGSYFWASEDIRTSTPNPGSMPPGQLTTQDINISGYSSLSVSLYLATSNNNTMRWEWSDSLNIQASIDGGPYRTVGRFVGDAQFGGRLRIDADLDGIGEGAIVDQTDFARYAFSIPGTGSVLKIRLDYDQIGGSEEMATDLIEVTGVSSCTPPSVTTDPSDAACCNYTSASFTVQASDGISYQWQVSTNGGSTFSSISNGGYYSNVTTNTLTISSPAVSMNGYKYRCVVTGACNPVATSNYANLTVTQGPTFTQNPQNTSTCDGGNAQFSVTISSMGFPSYTWYMSADGGSNYSIVPNSAPYSGVSTNTLTITGATASMSTFLYRVKLGNSVCANASPPSASGLLTVNINTNYYQDNDGDTYGNPLVSIATCNGQPTGYVTNNLDCNDGNATVKPGGTEVCGDGLDQDCSGVDLLCSGPNTWLGNTSQWANGANWSSGAAPTASTDALIPSSPVGGLFPAAALPASVHDLEMQNGASASFGLSLSVYGSFTGGATSNSSIVGNGIVYFAGSGTQNINGKCRFKKVTSNNSSVLGININGAVEISEAWVMQDGDLTNTGTFTMLSDATGTAYLDFFTHPTAGFYYGHVTMQRYIANASAGYHDISLPVNTTVADLADDFNVTGQNGVNCWYAYSPYPTLQEYREDANAETDNYYGGFWSCTSPTNYLETGRGYAARIYNAPLTLDVTGTPNYGTQLVSVTNTPSGNGAADGWNLIGNPYPAPIKWSSLKNMNPGATDGSCYRFATTGEYAGTWSAHNGVTGVPLGTTDEISTFQGFFVLAPASTYLFMENSLCTPANSVAFYKTDALNNEIRLQLTNGAHSDEIVAYTDPSATAAYDAGYDAVKIPAGGSVSLSFTSTGKDYAIDVLDAVTKQTELPLTVQVADSGTYTLNALELNLTSLTAYLKDAQTNTLYDLSAGSTTLTLAGGQVYSGRFSVVFKETTVSGIAESLEEAAHVYAIKNTVFVNRMSLEPAHISVSNVLGQQVVETTTGNQKTELQMPSGNTGYYFVKVTEGKKVTIAKVLITGK